MSDQQAANLHGEIKACTICAEHLPLGPRPVVQFSPRSRVLIIGQAPGTKVHASGVPWDDDSGDRLRDWLGIDKSAFYDADKIALMPMGFCYPGKAKGGDAPPHKECAPQWHNSILELLPADHLTLLVGGYAQSQYLPETRKMTLTERVQRYADFAPVIPLPHPAWRVRMWMAKNPWFEGDLLPALRDQINARLRD
ncbi:uracil-DNA glycosylase family protein [Erythrobacter crassostreae]|uniref:Uracil-DNA glycosylase family protein n=1 Tax=Erythrobacter crassostreae TaxID=2828328 RepID=A0A9X1JMP4_9SPHN|nr:uracil-DNA glycosylase family protein [Erythrobacter crassostrea]MBV7259629.1 uracil-DNA glycosylase family protein [Erythrobacter crassostrea]